MMPTCAPFMPSGSPFSRRTCSWPAGCVADSFDVCIFQIHCNTFSASSSPDWVLSRFVFQVIMAWPSLLMMGYNGLALTCDNALLNCLLHWRQWKCFLVCLFFRVLRHSVVYCGSAVAPTIGRFVIRGTRQCWYI
jgi:hypothetical protein